MSREEKRLVSTILLDSFGPIVEKVGSILCAKGAIALPVIVNESKLSTRLVKEALFILIHQNICRYSGDGPVLYRLDLTAIKLRLMHPLFASTIYHKYQNNYTVDEMEQLSEVIHLLFKNGRVQVGTLSSPFQQNILKTLLNDRIIRLVTTDDSRWYPEIDNEWKGAASGTTTSNNSPTKKRVNPPPNTSPSKSTTKKIRTESTIDTSILNDSKVFVRIDEKIMLTLIFHNLIKKNTEKTLNEAAASVIEAAFTLTDTNSQVNFSPFQVSSRLSPNAPPLKVLHPPSSTAHRANGEKSQIVHYLECMSQNLEYFIREDSRAGGLYSINFGKAVESIRLNVIESLIKIRFGQSSLRIFRIIRDHEKLEEKTISRIAMITAKETRERLYQMFQFGLLHMQEVPKTIDHAPSRTFFLWTIPMAPLLARLSDLAIKGWVNLRERERLLCERNSILITKSERSDVIENPGLLSEGEQRQLRALRKGIDLFTFHRNNIAKELLILSLLHYT